MWNTSRWTLKELAGQIDLDGDGVAPIGPDVTAEADARGVDVNLFAIQLLLRPTDMRVTDGVFPRSVQFIPGHPVAGAWGPDPDCRVMVIGKMPWNEEVSQRRLFCGVSGKLWKDELDILGVDYNNWYLTNVVRFMPPGRKKDLASNWKKECRWFLDQELRIIQPSHILLFGADAVKAILGRNASVKKLRGDDGLMFNGAKVWAATHPLSVLVDPLQRDSLVEDLTGFAALISGSRVRARKPVKYTPLRTEAELADVVDRLISEDRKCFSMDAEWGARDIRTIQFCARAREAYAVVLCGPGMVPVFDTGPTGALRQLTRLLKRPGIRVAGHAFRSDMKKLLPFGLDLSAEFNRGFDTMLGYHLLHPGQAKGFGLENLSVKYTDLGRYEKPLERWLEDNKYNRDMLDKYGYGEIPDEILLPYCMADVDAVYRAWAPIENELKSQSVTNPYELFGIKVNTMFDFYRAAVAPVTDPLIEIETEGFPTDTRRLKDLVALFHEKRDAMVVDFKEMINWPDFNFRSIYQVREFLFGFRKTSDLYLEKVDPAPGDAEEDDSPHRPAGALCLGLTPVKSTEKPGRDWDKIPEEDKPFVNPSTDSESLKILAGFDERARLLSELRYVDQVAKNFLRLPDEDGEGVAMVDEDTGEEVYSTGLLGAVDPDGRIRTSISQITDTGRYRSFNPNMQNLPKKQESELKKIFATDRKKLLDTKGWDGMSTEKLKELGLIDPRYHSIRTCFVADPGYVLIEADYKQAELFVLAWLADDLALKTVLSETGRDFHAEIANKAFGLGCSVAEVKKLHPTKRDGSKATVYGLVYGRGLAAVVRQLQREGMHDFRLSDAQRIKDTIFEECPNVPVYIEESQQMARELHRVETPFGRRRYFPETSDKRILGEQGRQAVNTRIQGTVADVLSVALINFQQYRKLAPHLRYRILLPVHDAVFLHVPVAEVDEVIEEVIPLCMREGTEIPGLNLRLDIDISVMRRWGQKMSKEEAVADAIASLGGR